MEKLTDINEVCRLLNTTSRTLRFYESKGIYFILMIVFTILFNEVKQNEVIGIRTSATLKYKEVWDRSHKLASYVFFVVSSLFLHNNFLKQRLA